MAPGGLVHSRETHANYSKIIQFARSRFTFAGFALAGLLAIGVNDRDSLFLQARWRT